MRRKDTLYTKILQFTRGRVAKRKKCIQAGQWVAVKKRKWIFIITCSSTTYPYNKILLLARRPASDLDQSYIICIGQPTNKIQTLKGFRSSNCRCWCMWRRRSVSISRQSGCSKCWKRCFKRKIYIKASLVKWWIIILFETVPRNCLLGGWGGGDPRACFGIIAASCSVSTYLATVLLNVFDNVSLIPPTAETVCFLY